MTKYVILHENAAGLYEKIGETEAHNAAAAIKSAVGDGPNGHYVATPAASWKPLKVSVETTRKVSVSAAGEEKDE